MISQNPVYQGLAARTDHPLDSEFLMGTQVLVPYWYGTVQLFRYSTGIPYGTATVNPLENQGTLWFRINVYIFTTLWIGFGSGYIYLGLYPEITTK